MANDSQLEDLDPVILADLQAKRAVFKATLTSAVGVNPDEQAKYNKLATFLDQPKGVVQALPKDSERSAAIQKIDQDTMGAPVTRKKYTDQDFANLAHDQSENLSMMEKVVKAGKYLVGAPGQAGSTSSLGGDVADMGYAALQGLGGVANKAATGFNLAGSGTAVIGDKIRNAIMGGDDTTAQDWMFRNFVAPSDAASSNFRLDQDANFGQKVGHTVGSTLGLVAEAIVSGAGAAAPAAEMNPVSSVGSMLRATVEHGMKSMAMPATMDAIETGKQVYEKTGSAPAALKAAETQYGISTLGGIVPFGAAGSFFKRMITGGVSGYGLADVSRQAMNAAMPDSMQAPEPTAEDRALDVIGGMVFGGLAGKHDVADYAKRSYNYARQTYVDAAKAEEARNASNTLGVVSQLAQGGQLRERDQGLFKQFVQDVADGSPVKDLYIDANTFSQFMLDNGVTIDDIRKTMPKVADQLAEAKETKGMLHIPVEDYATHIAGSDLDKSLQQHMKIDPDGKTFGEAQTFFQDQTKELSAMAEKIVGEKAKDDAWKESAKQVYDEALKQHTELARFPDAVNRLYAAHTQAIYETAAAREKMMPHELMELAPLDVKSEMHPGGDEVITPENGSFKEQEQHFSQNPYEGAPDGLMGYKKYGPQTPFGENRYKHSEFVRVTWPDGHSILDAMEGLNGPHALERARRNWKDAEIERVDRATVEKEDPQLAQDVDHAMAMKEEQAFRQEQNRANDAEVDAESDDVAPITQADIPESIDEHATLDNLFKLSQGRVWQKGRDMKVVMQNALRAAAKAAGVDVSAPSEATTKYLVRVGLKDALTAIKQNPNAVGWYDIKTKQALAIMAMIHPEIATDPNAKMAMIWAMAVTSNGLKVDKNFELAEKVYSEYKSTGAMPTNVGIGNAAKAINKSLGLFNELKIKWGADNLRKFMQTGFTVGEITAIAKELKPGGEHADVDVMGASIIGPKIGNGFYSNLHGNFAALTMDRWLIRTWGRWTGTLITETPAKTQGARDRLERAINSMTPEERQAFGEKVGVDVNGSHDDLAMAIQKASMEPELRAKMNDTALGEEVRKAGNGLAKYLDGQKEAPQGPTERKYIRQVFGEVLSELRKMPEYKDLTMADLQAVLWYAEKRLYESAKEDAPELDEEGNPIIQEGDTKVDENGNKVSGYEDKDAPDYANAAQKIALSKGIEEEAIKAVRKGVEDGRTADARQVDAGQPDGVSGQPPASGGFAGSERSRFLSGEATKRVRSNRLGDAQPSWSYGRGSGKLPAKPGLLKDLGVTHVGEFTPGKDLKRVFQTNGAAAPSFFELDPARPENAQRFAELITASKEASGKNGAAVYVYPVHDTPRDGWVETGYSSMRMFVTKDGKAGVAIKKDGDIVSVFSKADDKGRGNARAIMELATANGGKKLDCFDTILPDFYAAHGFKAVSRLKWDDSQAPSGWDKENFRKFNNGEPDVVFMVYDPRSAAGYLSTDGKVMKGDDAYNKAAKAQTTAMNRIKRELKGEAPVSELRYNQDQTMDQPTGWDSVGTGDPSSPDPLKPGVGSRGQISFGKDITKTPSVITLFKHADASTFLHEQAHFYLELMSYLASREGASEGMKADMQTVLDANGIKDNDTWRQMTADQKRDAHENFARGYEKYLMEGRAPTIQLQSAFSRFSSWLVQLYKHADALKVEISPELRGVFDRMLGSQEAIDQAESVRGMKAMFDSKPEGMTDLEYAKYQEWGKRATEDAKSDLQSRSLRDMKWLSNAKAGAMRALQKQADAARRTVRAEVTDEVNKMPPYAAQDDIERMRDPNRDHKEAMTAWRQERDAQPKEGRDAWLAENPAPEKAPTPVDDWQAKYSAEADQVRQRERDAATAGLKGIEKGQALMKAKRAIDNKVETHMLDWEMSNPKPKLERPVVDMGIIADMHGFHGEEEMLRAIAEAGDRKDVINMMTDQRMLQEHGELSDPISIERAAEAAIHNDVRAKFISAELKALAQATGPARMIFLAAREAARAAVGAKRISDLRPKQYQVQEGKAANDSMKAFKKGDIQEAAQLKRAQLLNNQLAKEAAGAAEEITKALEYFKRFSKVNTTKAIGAEYMDRINELLSQVDLSNRFTGKRELENRANLRDWLDSEFARTGIRPEVSDLLLNYTRKSYKEMTVDEFRALTDAVKSLEHVGRNETSIEIDGKRQELQALVDEAKTSMESLEHSDPVDVQPHLVHAKGLDKIKAQWLNLKSKVRSMDAALLKMEQMFQWLDAGSKSGVAENVRGAFGKVFRRAADAEGVERAMRAEATAGIRRLAEKLKDAKVDVNEKVMVALTRKGRGNEWYREELLALALNMGNEGNKAKLLEGYGWTERNVMDALNSKLTKHEWDYVQGVLDLVGSYGPKIEALQRRMTGVSPKMVDASPIHTNHGTYAGGYYPIVYDAFLDRNIDTKNDKNADMLFENTWAKPTTSKGHTVERTGYVGPIQLSLGVIARHIDQVTHDLAWREAIIDMNKFLSHDTITSEIDQTMGREYRKQLRPWLQALANDKVFNTSGDSGWENFYRKTRSNMTMVGLGFRLSTMLVHGSSALSTSIGEVGTKWMAKGVAQFSSPDRWANAKQFVFERSPEMANRMNEMDRNVKEVIDEINAHSNSLTPGSVAGKTLDGAKRFAMYGVSMLDMASAMPTWYGAYLKGMAKAGDGGLGLSEHDAVEFANKAVRNAHGGGGTKDLAAIQRDKGAMSMFTMFYSFWNHMYNRQRDLAVGWGNLGDSVKQGTGTRDFARLLARSWWYFVVPQLIHAMLKGQPDKKDDGTMSHHLLRLAEEVGLGSVSGVPILRDLAGAVVNGRDYALSPLEQAGKSVVKLVEDGLKYAHGEPTSKHPIKNAAEAVGYTFGLPTGQASSTAQFLWDVYDGNARPQDLRDWWTGIQTGKMPVN